MASQSALIIGAGLAGLACARRLYHEGWEVQLLEGSDRVGGRVRTDELDGYLLDRGFQVYLTAYEEGARQLDLDGLRLGNFRSGAMVRLRGRLRGFHDPWRHPSRVLEALFSPVMFPGDKLRIQQMRRRLTGMTESHLFEREEIPAEDALLRRWGFSPTAVERFFRPFFGGIFLERELQSSSRMLEFVFRTFSLGHAALPEGGMEAIPAQIARDLPQEVVRCDATVKRLAPGRVELEDGTALSAPNIVLACEEPAARRLLGEPPPRPGQGTMCLYYSAPAPPLEEPVLVLDGEGEGPANHLAVLSQVQPSYAPPGKSLVSITVLDDGGLSTADLDREVQGQMEAWFGRDVRHWRHLKTVSVRYALPDQSPPFLHAHPSDCRFGEGVYVCGDYLDTASINGALRSGRRAAERLLEDRS